MTTQSAGKAAIQTKVKRFVEGRRIPRDIDAISLWIRSKSYGARAVKDVGDFVGHAEEKNQGVAWDQASLIAAMLRYTVPAVQKTDEEADLAGLEQCGPGSWQRLN